MGKYVIKEGKSGYSFALKAGNGETIGVSEVYKEKSSCHSGIASVKKNAPKASIEDQTIEGYKQEKNPTFELYLDKKGEFRFRLKAGNGEIILASEAYKAKASARKGIDSVITNADSEISE